MVGIIIKAKSPVNKEDLLRPDHKNNKTFQKLLLYYMRVQITLKNLEIKHLIVTKTYDKQHQVIGTFNDEIIAL